jgi:hypothetical protein
VDRPAGEKRKLLPGFCFRAAAWRASWLVKTSVEEMHANSWFLVAALLAMTM